MTEADESRNIDSGPESAIERTEYGIYQFGQKMSCILVPRDGEPIRHDVQIKDGNEQKAKAEAYDGALAKVRERLAGKEDAGA